MGMWVQRASEITVFYPGSNFPVVEYHQKAHMLLGLPAVVEERQQNGGKEKEKENTRHTSEDAVVCIIQHKSKSGSTAIGIKIYNTTAIDVGYY